MSTVPPYSKIEDGTASNFNDEYEYREPPPAYNESEAKNNLQGPPVGVYPPPGPYAPQQEAYPTQPGVYPTPPAGPYPMQPQPMIPATQVLVSPQPLVTHVVVENLPPGTCTVCRKGRIEDTASCCTWLWCILLLPFGILPGICAFCCCCRRPKCTHCGFSI